MSGVPFTPDDDEPDEMDVADEVAFADTGRSWAYRAIRHPSHARTRAHLAANPLPTQADRRSA
ncbi:hypothetical protein ACIP6Q_39250 [Streptomyces bobili]|uniref:hypothetical protein n=1 Tax=Streptomyces bobili TaxID=67280 RepID=UPI0038281119